MLCASMISGPIIQGYCSTTVSCSSLAATTDKQALTMTMTCMGRRSEWNYPYSKGEIDPGGKGARVRDQFLCQIGACCGEASHVMLPFSLSLVV
jgi:hypothetical protein